MSAQPKRRRIFCGQHHPFVPQPFLPPPMTLKSWQAVLARGITEIRLEINPTLEEFWAMDLVTMTDAGLKVLANLTVDISTPLADVGLVEATAFRIATLYGSLIAYWSIGNEWGATAQDWEAANPGHDFFAEICGPICAAFAEGVRRAIPNAWIIGSDADSTDAQRRYLDYANGEVPNHSLVVICDEEGIHNYGDIANGNMNYAMMKSPNANNEGFEDVTRSQPIKRPWGITETDCQQFASARKRRDDTETYCITHGTVAQRDGSKIPFSLAQAVDAGKIARSIPTDAEIDALIAMYEMIDRDYPDCTRIVTQLPYFFGRVPVTPWFDPAPTWSTLTYGPEPVVSAAGLRLSAHIARVNGTSPRHRPSRP